MPGQAILSEILLNDSRKITSPELQIGISRLATRSGVPTFLLAASVQYKVAALETGLHLPFVLRVVSLRFVHCFTDTVLAHRRCLLGSPNEPKQERLAFRGTPFCNHTSTM